MAITLGLNTALSGLLTNQKGLDTISQNIVNVNTKGYVRKVMTPESVTVAGIGAGVQQGALIRNVDQGLLKDIRAQTSTQGALDSSQTYYPRIEDLFGKVGSSTTISHQIQQLQSSFETLATQVNTPAFQSSVVQTAKDTTAQFNEMTSQLQNLRLEADRAIHDTIGTVNQDLANIFDLNQKIVRNGAIGADVGDLQDKRDSALTDLAKYMDIQYFERGDGSYGVFTQSGKTLVDKGAAVLSHVATTITDSWMTAAGGNFNKITLSTSTSTDISAEISNGQLRSLLDMRDTVVPNLQAQIDEAAAKLKDTVNLVHNRGTVYPTQSSKLSGTRQFISPNNPTLNLVGIASNGTVGTTVTADGSATADSTHLLTSLTDTTTGASLNITAGQTLTLTNGTGSNTFTVNAASTLQSLQTFIKGATLGGSLTGFLTGIDALGRLSITTNGGTAPADNVTISGSLATELGLATTVAAGGGVAGTSIATAKLGYSPLPAGTAPLPQKMWLTGNDDTTIAIFDPSGNQLASTTLRTIMTSTSYTDAAGNGTSLDISTAASPLGVKITDVAAKVQSWMRQQSYQGNLLSSASASISTGKMVMDTGVSAVTLAFRDQVATADGSATTDTRINFDVDGDSKADQTVSGFSNFFGLNDFFVKTVPNSIQDSGILDQNQTIGTARTFTISDPSGQIGNTISVSAGANLATIAAKINAQTQTNESSILTSSSLTLNSAATFTITDANGNVCAPVTIAAGATSLTAIANAINGVAGATSAVAKAYQTGPNSFGLRIFDSRGEPLNVSITGGTMSSGNLSSYLGMQQTQLVQASVVPEGSGYRLRIRQTADQEMFIGATPDTLTPPGSILTDLDIHQASVRAAGKIDVRTDIQGSPAKVSRGAVQYNTDLGKYYLSEGDNTTVLGLGAAMSGKVNMAAAGSLYSGSYSISEYAAATVAQVSTDASHVKDRLDYETTLGQSLNSQYTSLSGVNIDEEVSNMINFQQAYSASAKVISTLQEMLDTLINIMK
ncbi:MAG: flagellar hook-associated protein FlgK [Magnetospirillum sp.]|nr:flagellar hook-associated protein FlgK [Magnetospirillum sp.]